MHRAVGAFCKLPTQPAFHHFFQSFTDGPGADTGQDIFHKGHLLEHFCLIQGDPS